MARGANANLTQSLPPINHIVVGAHYSSDFFQFTAACRCGSHKIGCREFVWHNIQKIGTVARKQSISLKLRINRGKQLDMQAPALYTYRKDVSFFLR
jgi:hypothetical protein